MSAFDWRTKPSEIDLSSLNRSTVNRMSSTATVERKRRKGQDPGAIKGLSSAGDALIDIYQQHRHGGAYLRAKKSAK